MDYNLISKCKRVNVTSQLSLFQVKKHLNWDWEKYSAFIFGVLGNSFRIFLCCFRGFLKCDQWDPLRKNNLGYLLKCRFVVITLTYWVRILKGDGAQQVLQVILMYPQLGEIWCTTVFLKLDGNADSDSVGMGWDPRLLISNMLPSVAVAACLWTTLWVPRLSWRKNRTWGWILII